MGIVIFVAIKAIRRRISVHLVGLMTEFAYCSLMSAF